MTDFKPEILDRINTWLTPAFDEKDQNIIKDMMANQPKELEDAFYKDLEFGTGGMRGIMGVGNQKKAIVKQTSQNIFCGIRLGGMGVAIGSLVGKELAELLN